jgi:chaperonin cofactor prefoldin
MALSFSGISAYTKQEIAPLLTEAVFAAKTQSLIKSGGILLPKTKSSVAVPKLATNANFQVDACGWNASGTTTLSQATVTVGKVKLEETICPKDFIDGSNKMDLIIVPSNFTKQNLGGTVYQQKDQATDQIVGEIKEPDERNEINIIKSKSGLYKVSGKTLIYDLNKKLNWQLPQNEEALNISAYIINYLGRIPEEKEMLTIENFYFEIVKKNHNNIILVKIKKIN